MKMRNYRVLQIGKKFYPQYRYLFFFWLNLRKSIDVAAIASVYVPVYMDTLEEAVEFIQQQILLKKYKDCSETKIHKIDETTNP